LGKKNKNILIYKKLIHKNKKGGSDFKL